MKSLRYYNQFPYEQAINICHMCVKKKNAVIATTVKVVVQGFLLIVECYILWEI